MTIENKPPNSFWIIAVFALLWNLIEIYFSSFEINFIHDNTSTEEFEKIQSLPLWYVILFIVALFSETLGSFMLFMRKKIATTFYAVALVTLIFIELYWLFVVDSSHFSIMFSVVIPFLIISIAAFLYFYSKKAAKKGWLK